MNSQQFVKSLHENYLQFERNFKSLSEDQIQKKVNAATWSIAENIDHIVKVNSTYIPIFTAIENGTYSRPFMSRLPMVTKRFGAMIFNAVSRTRTKKMKTFPIWEPSQSYVQNPLSMMLENHQSLGTLAVNISSAVQMGLVIASPASKVIVYTLDDALSIIIEHELRHLEQAKELLERL